MSFSLLLHQKELSHRPNILSHHPEFTSAMYWGLVTLLRKQSEVLVCGQYRVQSTSEWKY